MDFHTDLANAEKQLLPLVQTMVDNVHTSEVFSSSFSEDAIWFENCIPDLPAVCVRVAHICILRLL